MKRVRFVYRFKEWLPDSNESGSCIIFQFVQQSIFLEHYRDDSVL